MSESNLKSPVVVKVDLDPGKSVTICTTESELVAAIVEGIGLDKECRIVALRKRVTDEMVNRFLSWPLPEGVCSDLVATMRGHPHRSGTNLLTADEARQMLEYVLDT